MQLIAKILKYPFNLAFTLLVIISSHCIGILGRIPLCVKPLKSRQEESPQKSRVMLVYLLNCVETKTFFKLLGFDKALNLSIKPPLQNKEHNDGALCSSALGRKLNISRGQPYYQLSERGKGQQVYSPCGDKSDGI